MTLAKSKSTPEADARDQKLFELEIARRLTDRMPLAFNGVSYAVCHYEMENICASKKSGGDLAVLSGGTWRLRHHNATQVRDVLEAFDTRCDMSRARYTRAKRALDDARSIDEINAVSF